MIHCGEKLRVAMARQGCSGVELAKRVDRCPQQVSRWRRQPYMSVSTIELICAGLGITIQEFFSQ